MDYTLTLTPTDPDQPPAVRTITGDTPAELAQAVHHHARGLFAGQVDVHLDTTSLCGDLVQRHAQVGTFTLQPAETAPAANPSPLRDTAADTDTLHGYTAADIDSATRTALAADRWHVGDTDERAAAVRYAIVEHLCTTDTPPTRRDLVAVGLRASDSHVEHEMHHHGWNRQDIAAGRGSMRGFQRYWTASPTPGPEKLVVERLALTQIWAQLTPRQQRALEVMAASGDYRLAGQALCLDANSYGNLLSAARRRFLAWWHEGEEPSRLWRMTKRTSALDGTCRGVPRLRASEVDTMRLRRAEGATLREIAAEWGVAISTVSRYLRGEVQPVPDTRGGRAA